MTSTGRVSVRPLGQCHCLLAIRSAALGGEPGQLGTAVKLAGSDCRLRPRALRAGVFLNSNSHVFTGGR